MIGLMVLLVGAIWFEQRPEALAGGPFNNVKIWSTVSADPTYLFATSTNLVLVSTASSSYSFATDSVDQVNFNLFTRVASSTAEVSTTATPLDLIYCYAFSDSATTVGDPMWFPVASNCASWSSGTIATSTLNIPITNVNSKYMRIQFSSSTATSTRVGLHGQAIGKKGY